MRSGSAAPLARQLVLTRAYTGSVDYCNLDSNAMKLLSGVLRLNQSLQVLRFSLRLVRGSGSTVQHHAIEHLRTTVVEHNATLLRIDCNTCVLAHLLSPDPNTTTLLTVQPLQSRDLCSQQLRPVQRGGGSGPCQEPALL